MFPVGDLFWFGKKTEKKKTFLANYCMCPVLIGLVVTRRNDAKGLSLTRL